MPTRYVPNPAFTVNLTNGIERAITKRSFQMARAVRRVARSRSVEVSNNIIPLPVTRYGPMNYRGGVGVRKVGQTFIGNFFESSKQAPRYVKTYRKVYQGGGKGHRGIMHAQPFIKPVADAYSRIPLDIDF